MVDCFDRIAVQMTEIALEPVRDLARRSMLGAVSLRTPSDGQRFLITIEKRFADDGVAYRWRIEQIEASGDPTPGGMRTQSPAGTSWMDPEAAYWAAVDGLCGLGKT